MKKLTLGLLALLGGFAVNPAYATDTPCSVTVPTYNGGFTFGLSGLYWRATSPQRHFASSFLADDQFDLGNLDDLGLLARDENFHNLNNDYDWGFKASVGYVIPCSGNDVNLTYTHFNSKDDQIVSDLVLPPLALISDLLADPFFGVALVPTIPIPVTLILPVGEIVSHVSPFNPEAGVDFEITNLTHELSAVSEFKNHTWDLDFGQSIHVGCNFDFRLFGGLRYSKIEHKLNTVNKINLTGEIPTETSLIDEAVSFSPVTLGVASDPTNFIPTDVVTNAVVVFGFDTPAALTLDLALSDAFSSKNRFEGIGPRLGVDMNYHICGGFGLLGSLSTALLVGNNHDDSSHSLIVSGIFGTTEEVTRTAVNLRLQQPPAILSFEFDPTFSTTVESTNHRPEETRVVPNIDAKLGINYCFQFSNCSRTKLLLEAGYQLSHYFNAIDKQGVAGLTEDTVNSHQNTIDVSFDGPYISAQVAL